MIILRTLFITFISLYFLLGSAFAQADSITPTRREAHILSNGQLSISTRFQTELPEQLRIALKQGVALDFTLYYQLNKPTLASYRNKLSQWVGNVDTVNYRLSYHPLTGRYRVTVGTFYTEYNNLDNALKSIGAIANWHVLHSGTLSDITTKEVEASIRLSLSTAKLPKPFQINALTSSDWSLDSGWRPLEIN